MGAMGVTAGLTASDALVAPADVVGRRGWQAQVSETVRAIVAVTDGRNIMATSVPPKPNHWQSLSCLFEGHSGFLSPSGRRDVSEPIGVLVVSAGH